MNNLLCRLFPATNGTGLNSERMSVSLWNLCTVGWFKSHLVATFLLSAGCFGSWSLSLVLRLLLGYYSIAHIIYKSSWINRIFKRYDIALRAIPSWLRRSGLFRFLNDFNVMRYVFFAALFHPFPALIRLMTNLSLLKQTGCRTHLVLIMWWIF
jgi:hypothetical protein